MCCRAQRTLSHTRPPHLHTQEGRHKDLSEGSYYVHKGEVVCEVRTHYAIIHLRLALEDRAEGGKFARLQLLEHSSLGLTDPTGVPVPHKVPYDPFVFYRCQI